MAWTGRSRDSTRQMAKPRRQLRIGADRAVSGEFGRASPDSCGNLSEPACWPQTGYARHRIRFARHGNVEKWAQLIDLQVLEMLDREGYRPNVGIILCNARNEVFWGKRIREHSWQFPQGGIKRGETPEQAMYRELHEEVGLLPEHVLFSVGPRTGCVTTCRRTG
jgi:hypothetical protein